MSLDKAKSSFELALQQVEKSSDGSAEREALYEGLIQLTVGIANMFKQVRAEIGDVESKMK